MRFRYPKSTVIDMNKPSLIELGSNLDINENFTIMAHDWGAYVLRTLYGDYLTGSGRVKIGSNIYFGRDVTILRGATIGDNCIIGACSLVRSNIPSNSVAAGVPARVICSIEEYYAKRKVKQVEESVDFGVSIIERYGRLPVITDFSEEWCVFLNRLEYQENPGLHKRIRYRLGPLMKTWFDRKRPFGSFDEFLNAVKERYCVKHNCPMDSLLKAKNGML